MGRQREIPVACKGEGWCTGLRNELSAYRHHHFRPDRTHFISVTAKNEAKLAPKSPQLRELCRQKTSDGESFGALRQHKWATTEKAVVIQLKLNVLQNFGCRNVIVMCTTSCPQAIQMLEATSADSKKGCVTLFVWVGYRNRSLHSLQRLMFGDLPEHILHVVPQEIPLHSASSQTHNRMCLVPNPRKLLQTVWRLQDDYGLNEKL